MPFLGLPDAIRQVVYTTNAIESLNARYRHAAQACGHFVLGVLISAGEFRHGTITDTYLTTPRRGRVLTAKLAAGLAVGAVAGLASGAATLALSASWLSATGDALPMGERYVWLTLLGGLLWCTVYAVIGVAVGTLTRNPILASSARWPGYS